MHASLSLAQGAAAYSQPHDPDAAIQVLGFTDGSRPEDAVVISLRHRDHPEWMVTFVFGPDGPAALIVKPYLSPTAAEPFAEFEEVVRQNKPTVGELGERPPVITARLLRRLPIGELEAWARGYLGAAARGAGPSSRWIDGNLTKWFGDDERPEGRRGRTHQDLAFAHLAAAYVSNLEAGGSTAGLAAAEGWSESTVRNRLTEARRRGLLTAAPKGKAGGELTERARQLLEEAG